jgi:hypothetical protein
MATDLLSSLPAMQSIPKVLLDAGADRSEWDLRQCLEQDQSSTSSTLVAHHKIPSDPLAAGSNSRNSLADHISAKITQHQEERYQPKGESVRYRYCIIDEPNTATRRNDDADDNDADDDNEVEDPNRLTLRTYVERIDSHNCTSTYLSEVYVIETTTASDPTSTASDPTCNTATVSGSVRRHTFFYGEEQQDSTNNGAGLVNVQTQLERHFAKRTIQAATPVGCKNNQEDEDKAEEPHSDSSNTSSGSIVYSGQPHQSDPMEPLATAIVRALVQFVDEQVLQQPAVQEEVVAVASLQRLRRVLPITKMRFRWDAAAQRHVQLLNGRQQQKQNR